MIKQELAMYEFPTEVVADHYDPDGMIDAFFQKTWSTSYPHHSLGSIERYKNIQDTLQVQRIHKELKKEQKQQDTEEATRLRANAQVTVLPSQGYVTPLISPSVTLAQGQNGQYATNSIPGQTIETTVIGKKNAILDLKKVGLISQPLKHLQKKIDLPQGLNRTGMCLNQNLSTSSSNSDKYGPSSLSKSDEEMDFSAIININMDANQDITFDRVDTGHSVEILDKGSLSIDMTIQQAAGATTSESALQKQASQTPPSQRTTTASVQKGNQDPEQWHHLQGEMMEIKRMRENMKNNEEKEDK